MGAGQPGSGCPEPSWSLDVRWAGVSGVICGPTGGSPRQKEWAPHFSAPVDREAADCVLWNTDYFTLNLLVQKALPGSLIHSDMAASGGDEWVLCDAGLAEQASGGEQAEGSSRNKLSSPGDPGETGSGPAHGKRAPALPMVSVPPSPRLAQVPVDGGCLRGGQAGALPERAGPARGGRTRGPHPRPGPVECCDSWGRKELDTTERLN